MKSGAVYFQQTSNQSTCPRTLSTKIAPRAGFDQAALATAKPAKSPNAGNNNRGVLLCGKNTANS